MYSFIEEVANNQANIKVIGIGGGGCNAVERMLVQEMNGVEFIACNTDMQSLQQYHAPTCLQLGSSLTRGLGAGGNPKIGRAAAIEDEEKVRSHLTGADMVFITAGMGGGTGTGGAPVVAQVARDLGILTIAVVTLPFRFEGRRRLKIAEAGIRELEDFVDTLIVIPNEKLLSAVEPDTTVRDAFMKADEILSNAVQGISDLITEPGEVNVDFADVKTVMTDMGKALLGTGLGEGETRAMDAVNAAISSPLLDNMNIDGARGILINITSGEDLGMIELNNACHQIEQAADEDALIIFGHVTNANYNGRMKITVIATGFEKPRVRDRIPAPIAGRLTSLHAPEPAAYNPEPEPTAVESEPEPAAYNPEPEPAAVESEPEPAAYNPEPEPAAVAEPEPETVLETGDDLDIQLEQTNPAFIPAKIEADDSVPVESASVYPDEPVERIPDTPRETPSRPEPGEIPFTDQPRDNPAVEETSDPGDSGHLRIAAPETAEELTVSAVPSTPVKPERPELELSDQTPATQDAYPVVPDYRRRNLGSGTYKKETNLNPSTQRIYYGDINTPAFLRRKAD